jgi:hypothetical protein
MGGSSTTLILDFRHILKFQVDGTFTLSTTIMSTSTNQAMDGVELPEELTNLALALLEASRTAEIETIKALLEKGAPAWYQDTALGWSCLHYAAERRDPELLRVLLQGGAVWNAVDKWGRTAGEISLSLGDKEGWEVIRNEGVRSGMFISMSTTEKELIRRDVTSCYERCHGWG